MSTTTTKEIPRSEWAAFFDAFSRQHERFRVSVEVLRPDIGAQLEGSALRFEGISRDAKEDAHRFAITLGDEADRHVTHPIDTPTHVRLERSEYRGGTFETLEIETEDGTRTLVRFLVGVLPENMDGTVERRLL